MQCMKWTSLDVGQMQAINLQHPGPPPTDGGGGGAMPAEERRLGPEENLS